MPLSLKLAYTAYVVVLIPVYWHYYGPTNFLYFCDLALILTLIGDLARECAADLHSCVGILVPQLVWLADFWQQSRRRPLTGMTDYMFDTIIRCFCGAVAVSRLAADPPRLSGLAHRL